MGMSERFVVAKVTDFNQERTRIDRNRVSEKVRIETSVKLKYFTTTTVSLDDKEIRRAHVLAVLIAVPSTSICLAIGCFCAFVGHANGFSALGISMWIMAALMFPLGLMLPFGLYLDAPRRRLMARLGEMYPDGAFFTEQQWRQRIAKSGR